MSDEEWAFAVAYLLLSREDDAGAFGEERGGDGAADASGAAGDEGDPILELEVHRRLVYRPSG